MDESVTVTLGAVQSDPSLMLLQDKAGQEELNPTSQLSSVHVLEPSEDHFPRGQRLQVSELVAPNTFEKKFWRHKVQDDEPATAA